MATLTKSLTAVLLLTLTATSVMAQGRKTHPGAIELKFGEGGALLVETRPAWLGVRMANGDGCVRVIETIEGSPARMAGLRVDDRIVAVDGKKVESVSALIDVLRARQPGSTLRLVARRGEVDVRYTITLAERPADPGKEPGTLGLIVPDVKLNPTRYVVVHPFPAEVAKQEAEIARARAMLEELRAGAQAALAAGRYEAAAKAASDAAAAAAAVKAAQRKLEELKKNYRTVISPHQTRPLPTSSLTDLRIAGLEARLKRIEDRLGRIEKLLEKLAR